MITLTGAAETGLTIKPDQTVAQVPGWCTW